MTGEVLHPADEAAGAFAESLLEFSRRTGEPEWLGQWRRDAHRIYLQTELPHRADHLWRYTDPALFVPAADPFAGINAIESRPATVSGGAAAGRAATAEGAKAEGAKAKGAKAEGAKAAASWPQNLRAALDAGELSGAAVVADGLPVITELNPELARTGASLCDLREASRKQSERLREVLGKLIGPRFGKFEALNAALFRGGLFLHIPRGVVVEKPIHLWQTVERAGLSAGRLTVLVEAGATVTLIDEWSGGPSSGESQLYNVVEILAGADSQVHFVTVQNLSRAVSSHLTHRALLRRGVRYVPVLASFGGGLTKCDIGAVLEGEGSESEMTGFLSAIGRQRFDHHTVHHHQGEHTRSNLDFKTVLDGKARSAYTGLIRIEREARFSEAYQENRNLLLSETCRADSIPELEILTEEVQCKHGATVGPLDPGQLFYLESRAIPEAEAVRMIVEGHFESALKRLPEELQERLRAILRQRLKEI